MLYIHIVFHYVHCWSTYFRQSLKDVSGVIFDVRN